MRKHLILLNLLLATLLITCSNNKETSLPFTAYDHYFVNNTYPVDSIGNFLVIRDTAFFNKVFGAAATMNKISWITPSDFNKKFVISVIKNFGNNRFDLKIKKISLTKAVIRVDYDFNLIEKNISYSMTGNSIVMINIQSCKLIKFYENGKFIKQVNMPDQNK